MNHPFNGQQKCGDHYQQQQQLNYAVGVNTQSQQKDDVFSFWTSPALNNSNSATNSSTLSIMQQQQQQQQRHDCSPKNQVLVPAPMQVPFPHSNAQTHYYSLPPYPQPLTQRQPQFSGVTASSSFDPFSPLPSGPVSTAATVASTTITTQQLVPSSQNTFACAIDHPTTNKPSQPIVQYPQQQQQQQQQPLNNQQQQGLLPTLPSTYPHQQQQQQLVPTVWNEMDSAAALNNNDFYRQNQAAPPIISLPPNIRRNTTPPLTATQQYRNYTLEANHPRHEDSTVPGNTATRALVAATTDSNSNSIPPSPPRDVNERQLHVSQIIVQQQSLPPDSSPLPNPEEVVSSGHVLSRISFRTILLKRWKQTYWAQYGPHTILLFRSLADYQDWLTNPYHTAKMRDYLIKLKVDFRRDLNEPGVMGYQITQANRKGYERGEPIM
jgi:hypothetical protein